MRKAISRALSWAVEKAVRKRLVEPEGFEGFSLVLLSLYPGLTGSAAERGWEGERESVRE